ncbi:restriction endonuclease, SacI family [Gulosibacter sediminis]|uniref:restriction endonuclease, SacI family n=1 Tax=Gulosibacter sediminis TaxID=1729695 RepID=UPI0024A9DBA5|nr:restriction endonuclease, SacI family [Gulosibacter sediminis]
MSIKIDYQRAEELLAAAVDRARTNVGLPIEWESYSLTVFGFTSKTYTPALATLLLAKATNPQVDTLSVKATGENAYSIRGLGHKVIVPGAVKYGYTLRVTGREPLNNQPWFRYNRIDEFERVKDRNDYDFFLQIAQRANDLTVESAELALAAFLKVALNQADELRKLKVPRAGITSDGVCLAAEDYLRADAHDRPLRLQAVAAACLDLNFNDVRSRKLNDPSRDVPGDVQAYSVSGPFLSMEVRGKVVTPEEIVNFCEACDRHGIEKVLVFVDAPSQRSIDIESIDSVVIQSDAIHLSIFESVRSLVNQSIQWSNAPMREASLTLTERVLERLKEIDAPRASLDEWVRAVTLMQSKTT